MNKLILLLSVTFLFGSVNAKSADQYSCQAGESNLSKLDYPFEQISEWPEGQIKSVYLAAIDYVIKNKPMDLEGESYSISLLGLEPRLEGVVLFEGKKVGDLSEVICVQSKTPNLSIFCELSGDEEEIYFIDFNNLNDIKEANVKVYLDYYGPYYLGGKNKLDCKF